MSETTIGSGTQLGRGTAMRMFTKDGYEVEVVREMDVGFLAVRVHILDDVQGDILGDDVLFYETLYEEPPIEKRHERLVELDKQIADAHRRLSEARLEADRAVNECWERLKKLTRIPALRNLELFLAGRITHLVSIPEYGLPEIHPLAWAIDNDTSFGARPGLRLMSLFGCSDGDLEWRLNRYRDGSGSWTTVIPCTSIAEAREELAKVLAPKFAETPCRPVLEAAEKAGVAVPEEYRERLTIAEEVQRQARIAEHRRQIAALEAGGAGAKVEEVPRG